MADPDADGQNEWILAPGGKVVVKDASDRIEWDSRPLQLVRLLGVWDLEGDGLPELVARSTQTVYAFDGRSGAIRWQQSYDGQIHLVQALPQPGGEVDLLVHGYHASSTIRELRRWVFTAAASTFNQE